MIEHYDITETEQYFLDLPKNQNFVQSLKAYFEKNNHLTEKQEQVLFNMVNRVLPHDDLLNLETSKETIVYRDYYRADYHGDMLKDSEICCLKRHLTEEELNEKITDEHAAQYGSSVSANKYDIREEVEFPIGVKDEKFFVKYNLENFQLAMKKLRANRFRKTSTKNRTIKILRHLLETSKFLPEEDEYFLRNKIKGRI